MEGQGGIDTTIIEYQQLQAPPELDQQLLNTLDSHIKGHWTTSFQCISMLRSICKFFPQYIPDIFTKYGPPILDYLTHTTTTQLLKNILKLLMEVFNNGIEVNLQVCVQAFLPCLIKKAAMDSCGGIRQFCQQVLTIIATKCCYPNTIEVTVQISCDKNNVQMADVAIKLLGGILANLGNTITQINPNTLQIVMRGLDLLINGKRNSMKTCALDICIQIYTAIGSENYLQLMNYSLDQNQVNSMGQAMESHRTQKVKPPPFAEVLKQQKSSMRQSGAWSQNLRM